MSGIGDQVISRRRLFGGLSAAAGVGMVSTASRPGPHASRPGDGRRALVYRGPATDPEIADALANMLRGAGCGLDVRFVGPDEEFQFGTAALDAAAVYAQPGGGDVEDDYPHLRPHRREIRSFVRRGGRYLGVCLGAYLAGSDPGFGLLPVPVDQYIRTPGSTVDHDDDTVVPVTWLGRRRHLFFQDGPYFSRAASKPGVDVIATYPNGLAAALITRCGSGRVGVIGPHPEATSDWYDAYGLTNPDGIDPTVGFDFVRRLLHPDSPAGRA